MQLHSKHCRKAQGHCNPTDAWPYHAWQQQPSGYFHAVMLTHGLLIADAV